MRLLSIFSSSIKNSKTYKTYVLLLTLGFFYCFFFFSSSGITSSNDAAHVTLAYAMYNYHTLCLDDCEEKILWKPDYAVKDGKTYSDRLPGNAFMMIPFLIDFDIVSMFIPQVSELSLPYAVVSMMLLTNICGVLGLFLLFYLCHKIFNFGFKTSMFCMVTAGLCTLLHLESIHLYSHSASMFLVTLAVVLALKSKESDRGLGHIYLISGVIGMATLVELQNLLFLGPLLIYVFYNKGLLKLSERGRVIKPLVSSLCIFSMFILILVTYNYLTFGEILLKSNTYNPFFTEELSFASALSGNFWEGFGYLFINLSQIESLWHWSSGVGNATPGVLNANPIFIFSLLGYKRFFMKHRNEALLFICLTTIAVLIAAFHVTTLVRHIFTIHLLLYFPIVFFVDSIKHLSCFKSLLLWGCLGGVFVYSFLRQQYISNHYSLRDFDFGLPYLSNWDWFVALNIPLVMLLGSVLYFTNRYSTKLKMN